MLLISKNFRSIDPLFRISNLRNIISMGSSRNHVDSLLNISYPLVDHLIKQALFSKMDIWLITPLPCPNGLWMSLYFLYHAIFKAKDKNPIIYTIYKNQKKYIYIFISHAAITAILQKSFRFCKDQSYGWDYIILSINCRGICTIAKLK